MVGHSYALISPALPRSLMCLQCRQLLLVSLLILQQWSPSQWRQQFQSPGYKQLWNIPMIYIKTQAKRSNAGDWSSQVAGCSSWMRASAKLADQHWPGSPTKQVQCELNSGRKGRVWAGHKIVRAKQSRELGRIPQCCGLDTSCLLKAHSFKVWSPLWQYRKVTRQAWKEDTGSSPPLRRD